jgi:hypothetical protein
MLLSVYYALVFTTTENGLHLIWRVKRLPAPLLRWMLGILPSQLNPVVAIQYVSCLLLAGIMFVVLRTLGQIRPLNMFLCQLVGGAVFLAPIFGGMGNWGSTPGFWWLWVEAVVAVAAALLYANWRRAATVGFLGAAVLFHSAIWFYLYFPYSNHHWWEQWSWVADALLLPLLGTLAWALYVWLLVPTSFGSAQGIGRYGWAADSAPW